MKKLFFGLILSLSVFHLYAQEKVIKGDSIRHWTPEWQKQFLADREDPEKWDSEHYFDDLKEFPKYNQDPISPRVFPVPSYDLYPGTFDGIAGGSFDIDLPSGQRMVCVVNGNCKTTLNEPLIGDSDTDIYLLLAVVTDLPKDSINYDEVNIDLFSRNHPDVISQGYVRTSDKDKVEFVSFRAANNDAYAVVNMRLFNLNDGNIVIIVPQKDGSLRSMQIKPEAPLSPEKLYGYLTSLVSENEKVNKFVMTREDKFSLGL